MDCIDSPDRTEPIHLMHQWRRFDPLKTAARNWLRGLITQPHENIGNREIAKAIVAQHINEGSDLYW
jgi:hypothetical protein